LLPNISIITPTLNQARFIEETINSVLSQNYPRLEYIIIDGGSTDGTQKILGKYDRSLNWISEPDNGQIDAINKGLRLAKGDVVAYLNSDDFYLPNTLLKVGGFFQMNQDAHFLSGKCLNIDINGKEIRSVITSYKNFWLRLGNDNFLHMLNYVSQPATFWKKSIIDEIGYFNPAYSFAMDYDYWLRIARHHKLFFLDEYLAKFRVYPTSITGSDSRKQFIEEYTISAKFSSTANRFLHRIHAFLSIWIYRLILNKQKKV
jgi:glycosyltransferase involved in cell wall biosynthesis